VGSQRKFEDKINDQGQNTNNSSSHHIPTILTAHLKGANIPQSGTVSTKYPSNPMQSRKHYAQQQPKTSKQMLSNYSRNNISEQR
jgi:hypothetical protein